jgi:membrane associated rhomboid family serine protease
MTLITQMKNFIALFQSHLGEALIFISFIWVIHGLNIMSKNKLNVLGIIPRHPFSLILGPICSPFLHGDLDHIFYNSVPLFIMTAVLFAKGVAQGLSLILAMSILEGYMVWIFARPGNHIGASGLIMALFAHFLYLGYYEPSAETIIIAAVLLYYFGTLLFSIFPDDLLTSFEGHLAGFISGFAITHYGYPKLLILITMPIAQIMTLLSRQLFG